MRHKLSLAIVVCLFLASGASAQEPASAIEKLDRLRLELIEVQAQEEFLRTRVQELEEAMKPHNIERSLAGVGSTRPEEIREFRRRQLERERLLVVTQWEAVLAKRARLESEIAQLEVQAYHESAQPTVSAINQALGASSSITSRAMIIFITGAAISAAGAGIFLIRRLRRTK